MTAAAAKRRWWRGGEPTRPRLEQIIVEAERIVYEEMSPEDRAIALDGVRAILEGVRGLTVLPEALVKQIWSALLAFISAKTIGRQRASTLIAQMVAGGPRLLGQYGQDLVRAAIEVEANDPSEPKE